MPPQISRRSLLRVVAFAGAGAVVAGCDDLGPRRSPSPTQDVEPDDPQTWPADTELLMAARERTHADLLALALVAKQTSRTRQLERLWTAQQDTLEQLIELGGVPLPELRDVPVTQQGDDVAATSAPGDAATTSGKGGVEELELGRAMRSATPAFVKEISAATPTNLPLLVSLVGQHAASAERLGAPIGWGALAAPEGAAAVPLLAVTRPAIFGLEVLAARSLHEEREAYEGVLEGVRAITRHLTTLAGDAAPVAPLGYDLPEPLDKPEHRKKLARALVADIAPAALGSADRVRGDADKLMSVVRIVSDAALWTHALGGQAETFPGMTSP